MADRADATKDQVIGGVKKVVGDIGNTIGIQNDLATEGKQDQKKGDAQYQAAQADDKKESVKEDIGGKLKENVGGLFSEKQEREGKEKQVKADALDEKSTV